MNPKLQTQSKKALSRAYSILHLVHELRVNPTQAAPYSVISPPKQTELYQDNR